MDGDLFGEFTFATSDPTVRSNQTVINGGDPSSTFITDDDDWGDFVVNSGGLLHTLSLPKPSKPLDHQTTDSSDPGSAPGRVDSGSVRWEKPKGALPLSLFGLEEEEEEEESDANTTSFDQNGNHNNNKNKNRAITGSDSNAESKTVIIEENSELKAENGIRVSSVIGFEANSDVGNFLGFHNNGNSEVKLNLDWDPLNFNSNGFGSVRKEGTSIANGGNSGFDHRDEKVNGLDFKDAESKTVVPEENSKTNQDKTENGMPVSNVNGFNAGWNYENLDFNGWNSNVDAVNSSSNSSVKGPVDEHKELDSNVDDDDGWEFVGAGSKPQNGDEKGEEVKTKHTPALNSNGTHSSWDVLFSNAIMAEGDEKHSIRYSIDKNNDSGGDKEWAFMTAQLELQEKYIRTGNLATLDTGFKNSGWNALSLTGSANLNLDSKHVSLDLFEENEDFGGNDGWAFKTAETASTPGCGNTKDNGGLPEKFEGAISSFGFGSGVQVRGDLFGASQGTSQKFGESNFEFDLDSTTIKKHNDTEHGLHFSPIYGKVNSDENSWAFKDAFSEIESKDKDASRVSEGFPVTEASIYDGDFQGNKERADNLQGALPLSIFGDEETEADDSVIHLDISNQILPTQPRDKGSHLDISINDLISNLYSQAVQNESVNHAQDLSENTFTSVRSTAASDLANASHDLGNDSWEFQDASTRAEAENQNSVFSLGESHEKYYTKGELNDYMQFFSKLKEKLQLVTLHHFENLKKDRSAAALADEGDKAQALDKEIQDLTIELQQASIFSCEFHSENHLSRNVCLKVFIEVLQEPKFHVFEAEYQLMKKCSVAERDLRSAIELLKCVAMVLQILSSVSTEVQSSYVSAWLKMLSVCTQELRHGAFIWKQSLQENVHDQILSTSQGRDYFVALGEIYRVVEVLGSSTKLYKPWVLTNLMDSTSISTLLSECSSLWSSSGLEEVLHTILSGDNLEDGENFEKLLESIKYINDLDTFTLFNHVFSGQGPTCQLSALTAELVPGMKTVVWNGKQLFLTLANLWGNLISSDPPDLPCIRVS